MSIPQQPAEMSSDGREIWDWADRLSDHTQRIHEYKVLAQQIRNSETQCGSCTKWMTRGCPRERHDNTKGRSNGPSSQSIKCDQFAMSAGDSVNLAAAKAKLAALAEQISGKPQDTQ